MSTDLSAVAPPGVDLRVLDHQRDAYEFTSREGNVFTLIEMVGQVPSITTPTQSLYRLELLSGPLLPDHRFHGLEVGRVWKGMYRKAAHTSIDGHTYLVDKLPASSQLPLTWDERVIPGRILSPELDLQAPTEDLLTALDFHRKVKWLHMLGPAEGTNRAFEVMLEYYSAAQLELGLKLHRQRCAPEEIWTMVKDLP